MKMQLKTVLLVIAVMLSACSKNVKEAVVDPNADAGSSVPAAPSDQGNAIVDDGAFGASDLDSNSCLRQRVVYFDFDQDLLKPEYQAIVACHAKYLRDRSGARMRLEGHADERGTREYNLALGERRGNSVNAAFRANGADSNRIEVVSFGEERPVCLDSDDACWAQNRRVEIIYSVK